MAIRCFLTVAMALSGAASAADGWPAGLNFSPAVSIKQVKEAIANEGKPAMVFVTANDDDYSHFFRENLEKEEWLKSALPLLNQLIVVNATGKAGDEWHFPGEPKAEYTPRAYFLDKSGEFVPVHYDRGDGNTDPSLSHMWLFAEELSQHPMLRLLDIDDEEMVAYKYVMDEANWK